MRNATIQPRMKQDSKEIQVEFEKGKFWSLTLPGTLHKDRQGANAKKDILMVTLREPQVEKLVSLGMECNLILGKNDNITGRLEKISSGSGFIHLEIMATNSILARK